MRAPMMMLALWALTNCQGQTISDTPLPVDAQARERVATRLPEPARGQLRAFLAELRQRPDLASPSLTVGEAVRRGAARLKYEQDEVAQNRLAVTAAQTRKPHR